MIKSFLMLGQSNMAGRGFLHEVEPIYNEKIKMLRNGQWQMMTEPINYDRPVAGVSLAASFAEAWSKAHPDEEIGLIPCAEGGSSLDDWHPEGTLFQHALSEARFALKTSEISGILWHQGESDSHNSLHETYYEKLLFIIETLRKELNLQNIPLIIGGLGDFLGKKGFGKDLTEFQKINEELRRFAYEQDNCYFVTAEGLSANPDGIHLNAVSQRKFGYRYFEAYSKKCHILKPIPNENESLKVNTNYSKTELIYISMLNLALGKITYDEFESQMSKVMQL
ncbi:sialate O-acetylesterase [Bacillus thermocopriae]|uniref:Sialate O-acetylesterase n=1 Tax=Neobacillus thermocopriae TaxID=1215031 RepID=A0A6B3TPL8_9BACI|nr:sialate O-acetylesterase [Neobacillus thermocopriae]MED3625450.1 sialate O-acetylesterase [Neobacillus thermocopriae]MED3714633.1 sialate O-acetylesterase [Neobacillus thermocopriae]NEX78924.1 sialate O-acetylesterase [Neobacillus thermocopriae]